MEWVQRQLGDVRDWKHWRAVLIGSLGLALFVGCGIGGSIIFVNWPDIGETSWTERLERGRDVGLLAAGLLALGVAAWRGLAADRQSGASRDQVVLAQQGLLNDRYQKSAEMLGSDTLPVRLGGIHALNRLAREHPDQYHVDVALLFCSLARPVDDSHDGSNVHDAGTDPDGLGLRPPQDIQTIVWSIGNRTDSQFASERQSSDRFQLDLSRMHFAGGSAENANLSGVLLWGAGLQWSVCTNADFSGASLVKADLSHAELTGANLFRAQLWQAELRETNLSGANLLEASFLSANLRAAILTGAEIWETDFSGASLREADLAGSQLWSVDFSGANLRGADLSDTAIDRVNFDGTDLSGARFSRFGSDPAIGLTQGQLDQAIAQLGHPPLLDGVVDFQTGLPLRWG
ncbi:MAG: pentapeptide repeat-containing protein [Chloroflexota bacterium]|nr:pentapeptide repeat-containing protein [Chloroflexota bacterium]